MGYLYLALAIMRVMQVAVPLLLIYGFIKIVLWIL